MKTFWIPLFYSIAILFISCNATRNEGYVDVEGGRIHYTVIGEGEGVPILFVHGGPGGRSCGMSRGFSDVNDDRRFIYYDQLGSGESDASEDSALWTVDHFVKELVSIRKALSLTEVHLYGHSWGAALVLAYLDQIKPQGIKSVILSSPLVSSEVWYQDARRLLATLPRNLQDTITKYEEIGHFDNPAYLAATDSFYNRFMSRDNWPMPALPECAEGRPWNPQIYQYMWGHSEFTVTGTLKNFDRMHVLQGIEVPTLFVAGEFDEVRKETLSRFNQLTTTSEMAIIEGAGHATAIDGPEELTRIVLEFVNRVDSGF